MIIYYIIYYSPFIYLYDCIIRICLYDVMKSLYSLYIPATNYNLSIPLYLVLSPLYSMLSVYIPLITIYPYICYSLLILFPVLYTLVLYRIWVTPISKSILEKEIIALYHQQKAIYIIINNYSLNINLANSCNQYVVCGSVDNTIYRLIQ